MAEGILDKTKLPERIFPGEAATPFFGQETGVVPATERPKLGIGGPAPVMTAAPNQMWLGESAPPATLYNNEAAAPKVVTPGGLGTQTPAVPLTTQNPVEAGAGVPAPAKTSYGSGAAASVARIAGGASYDDIMKEIAASKTEPMFAAERPAGTVTNTETGQTETIPRGAGIGKLTGGEGRVAETHTAISDMIDQIKKNPGSYLPGGGMGKNALTALQHLYTAKAGLAGHEITAKEHTLLAQGTLEERVRHNKLLEQDLALRLAQQRDLTEQKLSEAHLQKFRATEFDQNTGKDVPNELHTMLNMGFSGQPIPAVFRDQVDTAMKGFEKYYELARQTDVNGKRLAKPTEDTPQRRKIAKDLYYKRTSVLPPEAK